MVVKLSNKIGSARDVTWHFFWIFLSACLIWMSMTNLIEDTDNVKINTAILVLNYVVLLIRVRMLDRCIFGN